jgi:hypothetical protein
MRWFYVLVVMLSIPSVVMGATLTAGRVPVAKSASVIKDGIIYDNGTNIGIGTGVPTQKVDVVGTVKATSFLGDGAGITGLTNIATSSINWTDLKDATTGVNWSDVTGL